MQRGRRQKRKGEHKRTGGLAGMGLEERTVGLSKHMSIKVGVTQHTRHGGGMCEDSGRATRDDDPR